MVGKPWTNAVFVVQVLARQLVDLIFIAKLFETDLAVLSLYDIRATNLSEAS